MASGQLGAVLDLFPSWRALAAPTDANSYLKLSSVTTVGRMDKTFNGNAKLT